MRERIEKYKLTIRKISEKARRHEDVVRLDIGQPSFDTPEHVKEAARKELDKKQGYTSMKGIDPLREAIADEEADKDGIDSRYGVGKENILATVGGMGALYSVFASRLGPEDKLLMNDPAWNLYKGMSCVNENQYEQERYFDKNGDFRDEAREEMKNAEVMLVNTPSNPEGRVLDKHQAKHVAEIAEDFDTYLLSDEVYHRLTYGAEHHSPAAYTENSGIIGSMSKNHAMTGWRLGWVVDDSENIDNYAKSSRAMNASPTKISQLASVEALRNDSHVKKMRDEYRERRDLVEEKLSDMGLEFREPNGAIYVFPDIGRDSWDFCLEMVEKGVAMVPGKPMGPESDQNVRICFGSATKEEIRQGCKILEEELD